MKDYIYKYVLTLVAFLFVSGATAQTDIEFDEDDSSAVADTLMPDTFKVAEQALPWNIAVAKHLDNLLEHDMFETSTVGMMVYDLDADSVLYSHNARQLLRPASTTLYREQQQVILEVEDQGIGIPQEEIEHIFQSFYRGSNTRDYAGQGIGLSLTLKIISAYHGKLDISSEIEKGTKVRVIF